MKRETTWKLLLNVLSGILIICGVIYAGIIIGGYRLGQKEYNDLAKKYTSSYSLSAKDDTPAESTEKGNSMPAEPKIATETDSNSKDNSAAESTLPADAPPMIHVDFDSLLKENKDVIAWISIPAIDISYPVLQADDNEYYLHRDLHGNYLFAGSIFADSNCSSSFNDYNTILYGHNMRDGSMFAGLRKFRDVGVQQKCRYFWVCTPKTNLLYKIFSVHTAAVNSSTYQVRFSDFKEYSEWLREMNDLSTPKFDTGLSENEKIVTLSTCTDNATARMVIQGTHIWESKIF